MCSLFLCILYVKVRTVIKKKFKPKFVKIIWNLRLSTLVIESRVVSLNQIAQILSYLHIKLHTKLHTITWICMERPDSALLAKHAHFSTRKSMFNGAKIMYAYFILGHNIYLCTFYFGSNVQLHNYGLHTNSMCSKNGFNDLTYLKKVEIKYKTGTTDNIIDMSSCHETTMQRRRHGPCSKTSNIKIRQK